MIVTVIWNVLKNSNWSILCLCFPCVFPYSVPSHRCRWSHRSPGFRQRSCECVWQQAAWCPCRQDVHHGAQSWLPAWASQFRQARGPAACCSALHAGLPSAKSCDRAQGEQERERLVLCAEIHSNVWFSFQIINWISENVMSFDAFDQIQEFILGVCFYSCDLCQFCM